jgi:manganese/iron transport system ATP-binding protein
VALINRTIVAEGGPDILADSSQMLRAFGLDQVIDRTTGSVTS